MNSSLLALVAVLSLALALPLSAQSGAERVLYDFGAPEAEAWPPLNDGVMGGLSEGRGQIEDGRMVYTGRTRLENNGGFSSLRSRGERFDLTGFSELLVDMKGDPDRKYTMILETSREGARWRTSYWLPFELKSDDRQTVRLPLDEFQANFRGRKLQNRPLQKTDITSIGIMVYDKKAGPFRVEVATVKASGGKRRMLPAARRGAESAVLASGKTEDRKPQGSLVDVAKSAGTFNTLLAAATAAGLVDVLESPGPFTVLAPSDEAFAGVPENLLQGLLEPRNKEQLKAVLLYHVLPGKLAARDLLAKQGVETAQGEELVFKLENGQLRAGYANIVNNDIQAENGVIHVIDRVLIPELPPTGTPGQQLIEYAISRGVDAFNEGDVEACASIYEVCLKSITIMSQDKLGAGMTERLNAMLKAAEKNSDRRAAAWQLREALDLAWAKLGN